MSKFNFKTNKWDSSHEEWKSFGHRSCDSAKHEDDETIISFFIAGNQLPLISVKAKTSEVICHKESYAAEEVQIMIGMLLGKADLTKSALPKK